MLKSEYEADSSETSGTNRLLLFSQERRRRGETQGTVERLGITRKQLRRTNGEDKFRHRSLDEESTRHFAEHRPQPRRTRRSPQNVREIRRRSQGNDEENPRRESRRGQGKM